MNLSSLTKTAWSRRVDRAADVVVRVRPVDRRQRPVHRQIPRAIDVRDRRGGIDVHQLALVRISLPKPVHRESRDVERRVGGHTMIVQ